MKKELQTNAKFRNILKLKKIGWRYFRKYGTFSRDTINMGKWNGIYDYVICSKKEIEFGITDVY